MDLRSRISGLVRVFEENVAAQKECIGRGDASAGNRHAKKYIKAFEALRALGDEGRDALVPLMRDGKDDVRAMTAAYLLRYKHDEARRVLEELARGSGFVAFTAGQTLQRWAEFTAEQDRALWPLDPE